MKGIQVTKHRINCGMRSEKWNRNWINKLIVFKINLF